MKVFSALTSGACLALLVLTNGARAEFLDFSYRWSFSPDPPVFASGTGSVLLSSAGDGTASSAIGGAATLIRGANVITTSAAGGSMAPDRFDVNYGMTLHLTDTRSGETKDLTFSGTLAGALTASTSTLEAKFDSPVSRQAVLGGHLYTVTINPALVVLPATGPGAEINALVSVETGGVSQPTPNQTPEPSTLVLAGLACSAFGVAWKRRRAVGSEA